MKRILPFFAVSLLVLGAPARLLLATDYFVDASRPDNTGNGLSPATAFKTITFALGVAGDGDTVTVAGGTYDQANGETFPLVMPDGLALAGPEAGGAVVDAVTAGVNAFQIGPTVSANPTVIESLTVSAATNATAIGVTGAQADLRILGCTLTGRKGLTGLQATGEGPANLRFSSNVVTATNGAFEWVAVNAGTGNTLFVVGNTLTAAAPLVGNGLRISAIGVTGTCEIDCAVRENTVMDWGRGIVLLGAGLLSGDLGAVSASVSDNLCSSNGTGIDLHASGSLAGIGGTGEARGRIVGNTLTMNGTGLACNGFTSVGTGTVRLDPAVAFNSFTGNSGNGVCLSASIAGGNAAVSFTPSFTGNCITGNGNNGVLCVTGFLGAGDTFEPDFGRSVPGPGLYGRNTISGNNTNAGAAFDFNVSGVSNTAITIPAHGNWWAASSVTGIQSNVFDFGQSAGLATVDFSVFLTDPFDIGGGPGQAFVNGAVAAGDSGAFVPRCGTADISLTFNGAEALNKTVSANGRTLLFLTPVVGVYNLVVTNPGGQLAMLVYQVIADLSSGSDCFIATATYGDRNAPEVRLLRKWRDECLAANAIGRQLVKAYYAVSPDLAEAIAPSPLARGLSRAALAPVVGAVRVWLELPWLYGLAGAAALLVLVRRKKA